MHPRSKPGELVAFARARLLGELAEASERILLASPFLSSSIATHVAEKSTATQRRLITALVPGSVQVGVLDPKGLRILLEAGFEIASIRNLHAKLAIADSAWGMVGSGNLTNAGLGSTKRGNVELGVVLDRGQIEQAATMFSHWWDEAKPVSLELIEEFDAMPRISAPRGALEAYGSVVELRQVSMLGELLAEDQLTARGRGYWVKSAYHAPDDPDWWHRDWISDATPPKYSAGDVIVIYLGKENDGPQRCPAILQAVSAPRDDRKWVVEHRDERAADQWPFVTETTFIADVPIADGVPLSLIDKDGRSVQRGNCRITRAEFETLARAMLSA